MVVSILSPCLQCGWILPGVRCRLQQQVSCSRFLDYIQKLHRISKHHVLIEELKNIIENRG